MAKKAAQTAGGVTCVSKVSGNVNGSAARSVDGLAKWGRILDQRQLVAISRWTMKVAAEVFKDGNSWAVRLPAALRPSSKELFIETRRNGDIILYDEKLREEAFERQMQALERIMANPVLERDEPL